MQSTPTEMMNKIFNEEAQYQRWLDVEAALARTLAKLGFIPQEAAEEISRKAKMELLDKERIEETRKRIFHPLVAVYRELQRICDGDAGQYIHLGVTTQDIWDTACMMQIKEAHRIVYDSLRQIEAVLLSLAEQHIDTIMAGRTHGVHALPITFGYKVVIWVREIRRHIERLKDSRKRLMVGHISGAVGTFASWGEKGPKVEALTLKEVGLEQPDICWQAARDRPVEFANLLAMIAATIARIANEVCLLMSTEISEVSEPWQMGVVGSSTMPHKRNPLIAEVIRSLAKKIRYNAALVTEVAVVEHERDLNFWLSESNSITESCLLMGEILTNGQDLMNGLVVYPERMKKNLDILKGLMMSEKMMMVLGRKVGKQDAYDIVYEDSMETIKKDIHFKEVLMKDSRVKKNLSETEIDQILDPKMYVGLACKLTREAIALSRKEREKD
ncbi:MAG: adenylosuccinate lyase [Spirochaetales bacterium]|nr:adenylosuccinate lyase [Spirochaetales bacterium]